MTNEHKRRMKIWPVLTLVIVSLVVLCLAIILPNFIICRTVADAKAFGHIAGYIVVEEIGDTNGPYIFRKATTFGGGGGAPFAFDLRYGKQTIHWVEPVSNNTSFIVTIFKNLSGNDYAVIRKFTKQK